MAKNIIELKNIHKEYQGNVVLHNINLNIEQKEFVTLLGPSGCGKTTTLRLIGGFESPTKGDIIFEGKKINNLPPYLRQINTVFQNYALFPHLDVYNNIAFGLKIKKLSSEEIRKKVFDMLQLVNLSGYEKRSIASLSGGQKQRIAIARALINEPKVLLLDEPLGALDLKLRKNMQLELKSIQKKVGITFIYVTHDQEEALSLSDRVMVMDNGVILQCGTPMDIYNEPVNSFVADFIGESNIIDAVMIEDYTVNFLKETFPCLDSGFEENEKVQVVIRPEDIVLTSAENGLLSGIVKSVVFKGVHYESIIETNDYSMMVHSTIMKEIGSEVGMTFTPDDIHVMKVQLNEE